ncbi:alpha/beta hydrolase [Falsihalocynthiibacter sp. SS001]|uniref:alpha/beta hydrolase n=1 Tax=Falsihalocynthiibacter sp. SS001 TaxID=3349698 RepID=UPI0036D2176D
MRTTVLSLAFLIFSNIFIAALVLPDRVNAQSISYERGVPYLTVRNRLEGNSPDQFYGDDRGTLSAGRCLLDQVSLDFLSSVADRAPFRIPEEILKLDAIEETSRDSLLGDIKANGPDAPLLYIHGYYMDFEKGCRRATVFKENAGLENRFLWFSWPSDGTLRNYARDEVNLYWSVPDLADIIVELHDRFGSGNVDLAGHSLGGRGLTLALYEIAGSHPDMRFGNVVLLASDIDFEVFRKLLPRIRPLARSITIYTSNSDQALAVSEQLHGYPRLGTSGNDVASLEGVEVIDTSDLQLRSASGHLYHIYNKEVGHDLNRLLNHGETAAARQNLEQVGSNHWRLLPD